MQSSHFRQAMGELMMIVVIIRVMVIWDPLSLPPKRQNITLDVIADWVTYVL
ncbi:MAG: hypothetical protein OHK0012_16960 [Synechococcales cyanobacterium]